MRRHAVVPYGEQNLAWDFRMDDEAPSSERSDEYYVFDFVTPSGGHKYVRCGAIWRSDERYI